MSRTYNAEVIFKYHKVSDFDVEKMELIREKSKELAYRIETFCPDSRERSLALTNLEQCMMWANASIARNTKEESK